MTTRHDKCEVDEKKKFMSYLKLPLGYGRSRSNKRMDSRAESSGANTPDPMSPHPVSENHDNTSSPITSPPATPLSANDDSQLPSISTLRRRTISQSRWTKDKESVKDETTCNTPEHEEVPPYDKRTFPLQEDVYNKMLQFMPENHRFKSYEPIEEIEEKEASASNLISEVEEKVEFHDSESTESAYGDEDPNDPEWVDMERVRDRHKR